MPHSSLKLGRAVVLAGLLGLALTACGRRGPLEPPPKATSALDLPDRDIGGEEQQQIETQAGGAPFGKPPKADRNFTIPEKSFVLDPIL
ncbi:LPS translocon maturation chaperone LptM [Bosea psychrotolerans]|uniref:Putative lipoprotein n=1 Tax=Bosea psychrotolerans TaxID=1871628 RepID=A0A2S4M848_9HYPH|nr:lipoprotein [Bosea psychrotolerans]POR50916.1 putative lipoprotein [Bosea psychrotolerans]